MVQHLRSPSSPAGISCGYDCSQNYTEGTVVTLSASPDADSYFIGWSGIADCTDASGQDIAGTLASASWTSQGNFGNALSGYRTALLKSQAAVSPPPTMAPTLQLYVDGEQVGSRSLGDAIDTTNYPLCAGGITVWGGSTSKAPSTRSDSTTEPSHKPKSKTI